MPFGIEVLVKVVGPTIADLVEGIAQAFEGMHCRLVGDNLAVGNLLELVATNTPAEQVIVGIPLELVAAGT